jgi:hypothetical protein
MCSFFPSQPDKVSDNLGFFFMGKRKELSFEENEM